MSIQIKNITKLYGEQKALDNVSFDIKTGEIVGFLGPNGAGKSTLMKIINGFIPPTSGDVWVNELDVVENPIEVKKIIGYLPENNPLYLDMYVKEYLAFVAGIYKIGKSRDSKIKEVIEQTGLGPEQHKKIGALSKGYRQRVGLAQALIHDPAVLILDEPTSGLDPNQIVEIRNLISTVGKQKTVMLSTHIMREVEAICDRVVIINKGKIVADDTAKEISSSTSERFQTIQVEFNKEVQKSDLGKIEGVTKVAHFKDNIWLLQARPQDDIRPRIFNFAVKHNFQVLSMQKQELNLEKVFQELTK
ncbi:MAG: gliding motility-associated ABC transporter ATP-binding subunit GldA [Bacteroidales bacterium]|nr:gliding motility-associated ABC transporter ATP-binding subunit GldA [Bacteroidales bacterium]MCF8455043.1 gliding motility-associated ABC transporter ATP-binding subunit GldA [Bacteroidales bacterium]